MHDPVNPAMPVCRAGRAITGKKRSADESEAVLNTIRTLGLAAMLALSSAAQAAPGVEVGFSPEGSARALVLKVIGEARRSIQVLAYAFQAPDITEALVAAGKRGVEVRVVVDKERNVGKASRAAMDFVVRNGVALRTNARFHLHHDKTIIVDGSTVQTGSFNYAPSAETKNSENVVVIREMPEVAAKFLSHWQSRWDGGVPYRAP